MNGCTDGIWTSTHTCSTLHHQSVRSRLAKWSRVWCQRDPLVSVHSAPGIRIHNIYIYIYIFFFKKEKRKSAKTQKNKNKLRENASETPTSELFVFSASTYCASQFHYINAVVSFLAAPLLPWISEHSRFFNSLFKSYSNAHLLNFNLFWQIVLQEFQALRWKSEGTYFLFVVRQFLSFEGFVFVFVVFLFFYF